MLKTLEVVIISEPRISAKLLCEYYEANPETRAEIIKSCKIKDPRGISISQRYNQAQEIISEFMANSLGFEDALENYVDHLKKLSKNAPEKKAQRLLLCAEAVEKFAKMGKATNRAFNKFIINNTSHMKGQKVKIKGVNVSIRPEMALSVDGGLTQVGFIKLIFSKTKEIETTVARGVAVLARLYYKEVKKQKFKSEYCYVIDVFANKIYVAPENDEEILDGYRVCCFEIAHKWNLIS